MKLFIFLIIGLTAAAAAAGGNFVWQITRPIAINEADRQFTILPGQAVKQVSAILVSKGIMASDYWFRTYVWLRRAENKFIADDFILPERANSLELFNIFTQLKPRPVLTAKILEGWSINDMADYFIKQGFFMAEEIAALKKSGLEGRLFPDTYEIYADAPLSDLVAKMQANFDRKVSADLRAEIQRQNKALNEILVMASIIEAEVPHEADRPIVSDIFWSRLKAGVALQSDATLKYVVGGKRPALTSAELKIDSPYNSYKYKGLPPTPIGNPGLSAIKAAIYPAKTDYFYFLSTPEGQTIFSRTLDEHNRAKNQFLR
ncbi:MAG: endolytic transglycosylase MltG [Patescibacteria group bacterium]